MRRRAYVTPQVAPLFAGCPRGFPLANVAGRRTGPVLRVEQPRRRGRVAGVLRGDRSGVRPRRTPAPRRVRAAGRRPACRGGIVVAPNQALHLTAAHSGGRR